MNIKALILAAGLGSLAFTAQAAQPTLKDLQKQINALAAALEEQQEKQSGSFFNNTSIGGYGEHHFNHVDSYTDETGTYKRKADKVDIHRFVLFVGHEFDEKTRFFSEFEIEHGLVKDTADGSNGGEVEVEQAYIEYDYAENHSVQFGQFLVPVGIMNERHEPDTFYGVERNNVEKRIIPTTWWETGIKLNGEILPALKYDLAIHSGLNNSSANIRSGRQKSANANAEDLAATIRLTYTGISGLELSTTVNEQKDMTQGSLQDTNENEGGATLISTHAIYQLNDLTLTALQARWELDGDAVRGTPSDPKGSDDFDGRLVEASYKISPKLGAFVRHSEWEVVGGTQYKRLDYGVNYWLAEGVALKADIQREVSHDDDSSTDDHEAIDGLNLGVAWSF